MKHTIDSDDRPGVPLVTTSWQSYRPEALLKIGWRRKWQIVLPAIVVAAAASWWIHQLPDRYRSEALLMAVPQPIPETFVRSTVTTRGDQRLQSLIQQILSRTQLEQIIRDFDLYPERRKTDSMQDIVDSMRARDIEMRPVKGDAFRLGFSADSPDLAMRVVERLVSLFIVETSLDRASVAEGTDQFLEAQLDDARRKLIDYESKLAAYRRRHNGELPTQIDANVRGLHNTEMQLQVLTDALNRDRDRQLILERSIKDASLDELIAGSGHGAPADAPSLTATELERAEASLRAMQSTLTEQHPDIRAMKQTIAQLRTRPESESAVPIESIETSAAVRLRRSRLEGLRAELSAVEGQIAQKVAEEGRLREVVLNYQRRTEVAPTREAELAALTRDYDTLQQTYRGLLTKKQESQIAANLERQQIDAHFKVLDPARLPEEPFAPQRARLYAIAAFGGLALGLMLAGIRERLCRGLRTQDDVRLALGLPVLAAIPLVSPGRRSARRAATVVSVGVIILACATALAWRLLLT
jgi:polysaccharide chain length determinant protein (PEP-CTERM system associated)